MLLPLFLLRKKTLDSTKAWIFPPNTNQRQLKGAILLGIAYFALFWMDYSGGENLSCKSDPLWCRNLHNWGEFLFWTSAYWGNELWGTVLIILCVLVNAPEENRKEGCSRPRRGSAEVVFFCSTSLCINSPSIWISFLFYGTCTAVNSQLAQTTESLTWGNLISLIGLALITVLLDFKVEQEWVQKLRPEIFVVTSLVASFITLAFVEWSLGVLSLSFVTFVCFCLIVLGTCFWCESHL